MFFKSLRYDCLNKESESAVFFAPLAYDAHIDYLSNPDDADYAVAEYRNV